MGSSSSTPNAGPELGVLGEGREGEGGVSGWGEGEHDDGVLLMEEPLFLWGMGLSAIISTSGVGSTVGERRGEEGGSWGDVWGSSTMEGSAE